LPARPVPSFYGPAGRHVRRAAHRTIRVPRHPSRQGRSMFHWLLALLGSHSTRPGNNIRRLRIPLRDSPGSQDHSVRHGHVVNPWAAPSTGLGVDCVASQTGRSRPCISATPTDFHKQRSRVRDVSFLRGPCTPMGMFIGRTGKSTNQRVAQHLCVQTRHRRGAVRGQWWVDP